MSLALDASAWMALVTLTAMEIVLGIDNIIFISILTSRLPAEAQARTRNIGLAVAMLSRLALLFSLTWIMGLTAPLLPPIFDRALSGRDLILFVGGLFLIFKATREIHHKVESQSGPPAASGRATVSSVLWQIVLIDMVFSLDSVITAVGMAERLSIMVAAVVISVGIMLLAAGPVSEFVERHPTVKMLALAFLLLIGFTLVAEGWQFHVPKGYIYFAMAFSVLVEMLNIRTSSRPSSRA